MLLLPRTHPLRGPCIQNLALALFDRYPLTGQQDNLKQAILHYTEAIFLPCDGCPLNIVQILLFIAVSVASRANVSRQPEDVRLSILYLRYLCQQSLKTFNVPRDEVKVLFVQVLALQTELGIGDMSQDIEEIATLCHDLLDSDIPTTYQINSILPFAKAFGARLQQPTESFAFSETVVDCFRKANIRLPDLHQVSMTLADVLLHRFSITHSKGDYEEGMAILDKILIFRDPGNMPSPWRKAASVVAASFTFIQASTDTKPEHLEQAIYRIRTVLNEASRDHLLHPVSTAVLADLHKLRFDDSADGGCFRDIYRSNPDLLRLIEHPSFRDLITSLADPNVAKYPEDKHRNALLSTGRLTDIADIEEALEYCRLLVAYSGSQYPLLARTTLADLLQSAFECTNKIEYLNEAISVGRDNLNIPDLETQHCVIRSKLTSSLFTRFNLLHQTEDMDEIMQLFPMAANDSRVRIPRRFGISCQWAHYARILEYPSTSTAYDCAVSLMQGSLTFSPTLEVQHTRLAAMRERYTKLPLDYASYQIHAGQLPQAIETLERGRTLLWSEMRGLRSSVDSIRAVDSHLADKFVTVNKDLEMLTLSFSPNGDVDGRDSDHEGMEPFGRIVMRQQKLLNDREELISQIQALPGLETFLKPPSFETLRSAALQGPVIIINHCKWRSDILILLHDSPPSLILTTNDFYIRANNLQDRLEGARKHGLESDEYEGVLSSVLKELYDLIGRPVIQRLNELKVPKQSRIWWCPTSAFCSLPLHAMGPIPSGDGSTHYFLDLYIPSYTPSLSALIESRKPGSQEIGKPSMLLVAQPDEKMPEALKEMKTVQAVNTDVTTLFSGKATPIAVLRSLRDHPFTHVVCHGILEPGKPFEASFKLSRGKRLSLLDIVRSQLPDAEFAFLSACRTAEQTEESIADEVLHLAAAMQFCGFRSVVGTMWAMADIDGRDLARDFYDSVFSDRMQGAHHYERTAEALRDAVKNLRRKRGMTLERWVNFVHYGA